MLSTFRTLGDAPKFFTGLKKQQWAQDTHRHTCPRHSPPFPPSTVQQVRVADPELLFFHSCRHIHKPSPLAWSAGFIFREWTILHVSLLFLCCPSTFRSQKSLRNLTLASWAGNPSGSTKHLVLLWTHWASSSSFGYVPKSQSPK